MQFRTAHLIHQYLRISTQFKIKITSIIKYLSAMHCIMGLFPMRQQIGKNQMSTETGWEVYARYSVAAESRGSEYFNTEDFQIIATQSSLSCYQIIEKVGRGKYSDVYKAIRSDTDAMSVVKVLKPGTDDFITVRMQKIKRQIKILLQLNHPNIINLQNVFFDSNSKSYILAFPFCLESRANPDIKGLLKELLSALLYTHSQGIMHRDIKPQNILLTEDMTLKIIDWGLAEFYLPKVNFNVRVGSRYYKAPELLLNYQLYDYSVDMWATGCVFGAFLFNAKALFAGEDNYDQLRKIIMLLGSEKVQNYIKKYKIGIEKGLDKGVEKVIKEGYKEQTYEKYFEKYMKERNYDKQALDLLKKMLVIDHKERINAYDALNHPYFN